MHSEWQCQLMDLCLKNIIFETVWNLNDIYLPEIRKRAAFEDNYLSFLFCLFIFFVFVYNMHINTYINTIQQVSARFVRTTNLLSFSNIKWSVYTDAGPESSTSRVLGGKEKKKKKQPFSLKSCLLVAYFIPESLSKESHVRRFRRTAW